MHFIGKYIPHQAIFTTRRYLQPFVSIITLNVWEGDNLPPPRYRYTGVNTVAGTRVISVVRQQVNELMLLKLVKTYCFPRLLYGCEIWPTETLGMHELELI